ncbi:MAG TPA: hypothetical protein VH599_20780 [Ktedonobacterales bacterium]|jgi:hypothetical protein
MPTVREFEDAAVDYCLDSSGVGVWAMKVEEESPTEYHITVRLGGHYRGELGGVAVIGVTYHPQQDRFICQPVESIPPEVVPADDPAYLFR